MHVISIPSYFYTQHRYLAGTVTNLCNSSGRFHTILKETLIDLSSEHIMRTHIQHTVRRYGVRHVCNICITLRYFTIRYFTTNHI